MKKIIEFLKKFFGKIFKYVDDHPILVAVIILALFMGGSTLYKNHQLEEAKKNVYTERQIEHLFELKGDKLNNVKTLLVVGSGTFYSGRDVIVRYSNDKRLYIYKKVSPEGFSAYSKAYLDDYIKKNPKFDFRYVNNHSDAATALGLKEKLITPEPKSDQGGASSSILSLLMLLAIVYLVWSVTSGNGITSKISTVMPKDIKDDLDDLIGMEDIKAELLQLEDMYLNRELYKKYNIHQNFNVMMTGGAGLGKTKIARCLTKKLNIPMIYTSASGLQSGYVGGGARALKALVKQASKFKRAIIFLDEAEILLMNRTEGMQQYQVETINALLSLLDGVNTSKSEIIWIVASNMDEHKVNMDAAMLRRFHLKINFRMPNFDERKKLIEVLLGKIDKDHLADDVDSNKLAGISSGISYANLEVMIKRAGMIAIQEESKVTQDILMQAFERVNVGLTDRATTDKMPEQRRLVAIHEAGHFLMKVHAALQKAEGDFSKIKEHIDVIKISTEAVSKMNALGFVLSKEKEVMLESLTDYESSICQLYGGMVNEELFYGQAGVTAGAHNDIQKVSALLKVMITEIGFYQDYKLNYSVINKDQPISAEQDKLMKEKSKELYKLTVDTLTRYKELSEKIADVLMERYQLQVDEALEYVAIFLGGDTSVQELPLIESA